MREIGGWFGLERVADAPRRIAVLGCPFDGAASGRCGSAQGPAAIRKWATTEEAIDEQGRALVVALEEAVKKSLEERAA